MADFYADENFRYPVVEALRRLGHDVLTCQEAGCADQGIPDNLVLEDARARHRILLTQNRKDFIQLDRAGQDHRGIVVCTYDPTPRRWPGGSIRPSRRRRRAIAGCSA